MTEASNLKEEAKKNIRSLLQSAKEGRTLHELRCDFRDFFFSELPGKEFGYNSPEEFLRDIPDVAEISYSGGNMIFKAVASASTAHIQRLVSLNKPSTKKKSSKNRNAPFWFTPPPPPAPPSSFKRPGNASLAPRFQKAQSRQSFQNKATHGNAVHYNEPVLAQQNKRPNQSGRSGQAQHHRDRDNHRPPAVRNQARHRTVPVIPAFIQGQIHELLDSNPHGLPLTHFCRVFKLRFKVPIEPEQMGFPNEQEMLASVPNVAALKTFPQGEVRVILAKQAQGRSPAPGHGVMGGDGDHCDAHHHSQLHSFNGQAKVNNESSETEVFHHSQPKDSWEDLFTNHFCNIPSHVQDKMKKLIEKKPQGIYASNLVSAYKDEFHEMLQIKSYGYNSVIDFVSDLSHVVGIERPHPQGDWLLHSVNSKPDPQAVKESQSKIACSFTPVEDEVKESICQVLGAHPSGLVLGRFLDTYKEMTGSVLEVEKYGKGTLKQFLHTLSDILNIILDASDNLKVCAKFQQGPRRFDKLLDNYRPTAVTQGGSSAEPDLDLPSDVVTPGCFYKPLPLPRWEESDHNYIDVYVSFVINPSCFWVQLRGERTTLALEELMDDLEKHYKDKPSRRYHMPPSLAKEGTLCAAIYPEDGFWYRAIILGFESPLYKIYYVDYGNTCTVTIDNLRLLKRRFMKLPAQAIKARLSHIKPVTPKWSIQARNLMLELCREIPLVGLVSNIKDRTLSLCLTDTRGQDDVHVNDMLVHEKYAFFSPDQDDLNTTATAGQGPSSQMLFGGDSDGAVSAGPVRRYIRQAKVNDDLILNLINLCGKGLYLISAEISSLFFKEDIISSMLIKDNAKIQKVVVAKTNYPDLFHELMQYEVQWVSESTTRLGLYPLAGLPLIIDLYGQGQEDDNLKDTVLEILEWYAPDDPYWRGEDDDVTTSDETETQHDGQSVASDSSEAISLEDLKQALNILQMKRKHVLRKIMSNDGNVDELVNELNGYELSIKRVEERKAKQESQEAAEIATAMESLSSSSRSRDEISSASTSKMSMTSQSVSSSLSSLGLPPAQASSAVPPTLTSESSLMGTTLGTSTMAGSGLASTFTPQQQHNFLLNSMYMSSLGLFPNLSQSALHGLSATASDGQLSGFLPQPPFTQGLTAMPTACNSNNNDGQLGNPGGPIGPNQNLSAQMPGAGRGFAFAHYPATLAMTPQMTAFNQALLAANPQLYNSQLLSMSSVPASASPAVGANPRLLAQVPNPNPNPNPLAMPHRGATATAGAPSALSRQSPSGQTKSS